MSSTLFQATTDNNELTNRRLEKWLSDNLSIPIGDLRRKVSVRVNSGNKNSIQFLKINVPLTSAQIDIILRGFPNLEKRGKPIDPDRGIP